MEKTNLTLAADRDGDFSIALPARYYTAHRALFALDRQAPPPPARRAVAFPVALADRYYTADRALFALDRQATRRLTLRFSSTYGRDVYPALTLNPANAALGRRVDAFSFTAIGWRYTLRHARGGFDIGYYRRRSNFDIDEQSGIRLPQAFLFNPIHKTNT